MQKSLHRFGYLRWAACALAIAATCAFAGRASAQSLDNKGKDFILAFLPNFSSPNVELHLASEVSTTVTVEYPVNAPTFTSTVAVNPGTVTIVSLPVNAAQGWGNDSVQNNCVRAFTTDGKEFVSYLINIAPYTSDAALALPIDTMNTSYIVLDYNPTFAPAEFAVYAAYDNTTVTIKPRTAMGGGHPAGVPFNVVLNRGEGYIGKSVGSGPGDYLTGTTVEADKPVGVVNGSMCHQVPTGSAACDHTFEVAQPVASWGNRVFVADLPLRNGSLYRILASQDNTTIKADGVLLTTLNKGQNFDWLVVGNHVIEGDKPIFVAQWMTGVQYGGNTTGDPAMANMIPSEQYLNHYTFSTVGGGQFAANFVSVIAQTADIGAVLLDGLPIPAASFAPVPGSGHSAALIELTSGTHTTASPNPHGITVEGYNQADSYSYPGGALFQFINPVGDANEPICQLVSNPGPPPSVSGTATDNRPTEDTNGNSVLDPGEDLNGNGQIDVDTGIFFVQLAPGAVNLTLTVTPFIPGAGVVNYQVTLTDPSQSGSGAVVVTDGAGNQCGDPIDLIVAPSGVPPDLDVVVTRIASSWIAQLDASDDTTPVGDIKIWVFDTATPAFEAGPYTAGQKLLIRRNPNQAAYARPLTGAYKAQIQVRGQAQIVAEDEDGLLSPPVLVP